MKKLVASVLSLALALSAAPVSLMAAAKATRGVQTGQISGQATVDGKPLGDVTVRLRNVDTKQLVDQVTADASGNYNFTGHTAGNYVVETVGKDGTILGTSPVIKLTATALVATGVLVATSGATLAAAGGVAAAVAGAVATGAGAGFLGLTTAAAFAAAAATAGLVTAAVVVAKNDGSPSR